MKKVAFEPEAFEQIGEWATEDKRTVKKILGLIKDTAVCATTWFFNLFA